MLITKEVEVDVSGSAKQYYLNKGYKIPQYFNKKNNRYIVKQGTKIRVKVEDLPPTTKHRIVYLCDSCNKEFEVDWASYQKNNHDGKNLCNACVRKIYNSGENNWNWKPNKTSEERELGRCYPEYTTFVKSVLIRDNYTCQCCGKHSHDIDVHHLYGYAGFPEYRTSQEYSLVLCKDCHKAFHTWHTSKYGANNRGNCTKEQFEEWSGIKELMLKTYNGELPSTRWAINVTDNEIIKSIVTYSNKNNLDHSAIYACCNGKSNIYHGKVYMWYDEYIKFSSDEINEYIQKKELLGSTYERRRRPVVCVNLHLLFNSIICGAKYFNISYSNISGCCNGKYKSSGKYNGERLVWKYASDVDNIDEFVLIPNDECINHYNQITSA